MLRFPGGHERDRGGKVTKRHVLFKTAKPLCHEGRDKAGGVTDNNLACFHHKYRTPFR